MFLSICGLRYWRSLVIIPIPRPIFFATWEIWKPQFKFWSTRTTRYLTWSFCLYFKVVWPLFSYLKMLWSKFSKIWHITSQWHCGSIATIKIWGHRLRFWLNQAKSGKIRLWPNFLKIGDPIFLWSIFLWSIWNHNAIGKLCASC